MSDAKSIMDYDTVRIDDEKNELIIIDQTKLPGEIEILHLKTAKEIWDAIYLLRVRGAPAIGVAAAYGLYIVAKNINASNYDDFYTEFSKVKNYLNSSRPTAVNLSWALERMNTVCAEHKNESIKSVLEALLQEAKSIQEEDIATCRKIGEYALTLVKPGDGLLTHCNAGQLATSKFGTATAPMYLGKEKGYDFRIFADETRPLLQGARLTAFELYSSGLDVTLICDTMSASVMKNGWVNAVFTGCDRVAANGDTANKIGTSVVAICANYYHIPFYICAPTSSIDMNIAAGDNIKIEQRPAEEVTEMWYKKRMAPEGIKVFNPAFDVTDNSLIAGIITEYGIARPPYSKSLKEIFAAKAHKAI